MSLDEQEAQRAAFAQFERENELRRARQQQQQSGHRPDDEEADASAAASGTTGGLWNMLGGALRRHVDNAGQGVPFPLSVMLDPAQVRQRLGEGGGSGGGGGGTIVGHDLGDGRGMRFSFSSSSGGHPTFFGFRRRPLQQAELDVDNLDYEQLLQLEEALGSVKPKIKAAERGQIEALPVREWHKKPASSVAGSAASASSSASAAAAAAPSAAAAAAAADQGEECSICMCEFEEGDAVKTLPCFHSFHAASATQRLSRCPAVAKTSSSALVHLFMHGIASTVVSHSLFSLSDVLCCCDLFFFFSSGTCAARSTVRRTTVNMPAGTPFDVVARTRFAHFLLIRSLVCTCLLAWLLGCLCLCDCLSEWLLTNETCPVCRVPVSGTPAQR
jgi:hypothetical protein